MFKKFAFAILLSTLTLSHAAPKPDIFRKEMKVVELPNADTLKQRLQNLGINYFVEKSKIVKKIAGLKRNAQGVIMEVYKAYWDYYKYDQDPIIESLLEPKKIEIIEAILKDYPDVLEQAKELLGNSDV